MSANGANDPTLSSPWHLSCTLGVTLRLPHYSSLDQPSALPRYQHGGKTDSPVIEVICGAGCGLFMLLTPLYRNTGAAHPSPRIYIWRSRANICIIHVSSVTTCLHTVQCPTIVTLTANYASITGPVSGRRKGREQRDEYKLCFVRGDCCGCGVLSSVRAACSRVSP